MKKLFYVLAACSMLAACGEDKPADDGGDPIPPPLKAALKSLSLSQLFVRMPI